MYVTSAGSPPSAPRGVATAKGSPLHALPAASLLAPIIQGGQPPSNIVDALVVPAGSRATGHTDNARGVGLYDWTMNLSVNATEADVIAFYESELPAEGWRIEGHGPAPRVKGGYEILATKAGSDGYYWDVAVVSEPTAFPGSSSLPPPDSSSSSGSSSTPFSLEVYQASSGE